MKKRATVFLAIALILCATVPTQAMAGKGVDGPTFLMRYIFLVNDMKLTISDADPIYSPSAPKTGKPGISYDKYHTQIDADTMQVQAAWFSISDQEVDTLMRLVAFMYALKEDVSMLDVKAATGNSYQQEATDTTVKAAINARKDSPLDWGDYYIYTIPDGPVLVEAMLK